jgi:hypothetical protein
MGETTEQEAEHFKEAIEIGGSRSEIESSDFDWDETEY